MFGVSSWSTVVIAFVIGALGCGSRSSEAVAPPTIDVADSGAEVVANDPVVHSTDAPKDGDCIRAMVEARHLTGGDSADVALFREGLVAYRNRQLSTARERLLALTETHPKSKLLPHAFLLFAEMFAEDAEKDETKWAVAENFYVEAMKFPYPGHRAFFYAVLRTGTARANQEKHQEALAVLTRVHSARKSFPDAPCIAVIERQATTQMATSYAVVGAPKRAYSFFAAHSEAPLTALLQLVEAYATSGKRGDAAVVGRVILNENPNQETCLALRNVADEHQLEIDTTGVCPP